MKCNTVTCLYVAGAVLLNIAGLLCQSDVCGKAPLNTKIVGGQTATKGFWPWQISVSTKAGIHFCGGSLISKTWVLSAAHCFKDTTANTIVVYLGRQSRTNASPDEKSSGVQKIIKHPKYNDITEDNDIALLQLSSSIEYTNFIQPVCLAASGSKFGQGTKSWVTGWGRLKSDNEKLPENLQEVQIPIVGDSACKTAYSKAVVTDNMICAGLLNQGGKDACQGDSGGPLVSKKDNQWIQSGIVSWGQGCAEPGFPGVYAKVSQYQDWITSSVTTDQPGFILFYSNDTSISGGSSHHFVYTRSLAYSSIPLIFSLYLFA